jgi:hypothetical protein
VSRGPYGGLRARAGVNMVQGQVTLLNWTGLDWACAASASLQLHDFSPAKPGPIASC